MSTPPPAKIRIRACNHPNSRGDVVVGYNPSRREAHSGAWVWFTREERDRLA